MENTKVITKIDEALEKGIMGETPLDDNLKEMLILLKDIIRNGVPLNTVISLIEAANACKDTKGGVINA